MLDTASVVQHEVVVVGAGWMGLVFAKTYLELAPDTDLIIVDEGKSVGGVWSEERLYPDLYAQVSHPLFEYSFYPMPKEGVSKDGFISGNTINKYLARFAQDFNLTERLELGTKVTQVERSPTGSWILSINPGPLIECSKLVWAVGATSRPFIPSWPRSDSFSGLVIHSHDTGANLEHILSQQVSRATVVGAAKSSLDTVYLLLKAGKKVDWLIREEGAGSLAMAAPTFLGIWNIIDAISTRALASFSPSIMNTSGFLYKALHRTRAGRLATKGFWHVATWLSDRAAGYGANEKFDMLRPSPDGSWLFWARAGLGTASAPDFWKVLHNGDMTVHRTEIGSLSGANTVNLKNGTSIQSDLVIACTGFERAYRAFNRTLREELGITYAESDAEKWRKLDARGDAVVDELLPFLKENAPSVEPVVLPAGAGKKAATSSSTKNDDDDDAVPDGPSRHYRRLIPLNLAGRNDRSICFPGVVHTILTPTVWEVQALWCAAYMLGQIDPPESMDEMEMEVATFNAWARKRYLDVGRRHAYCIYDFLSYIDTLARDLGIKTNRKKNWFQEMFVRYKPSDYRGLVDEFLATQRTVWRHRY